MTSESLTPARPQHASNGVTTAGHRHVQAVPGGVAERRIVSVLFVDVRGSMELSSSIDLEEWWHVLSGLFELMSEGVHRFGGWVGNFTGDGVNAVFEETADADDEHVRRACEAALWLREAMRGPASAMQRDHGLELALRMGLNSGEVLIGTIGDWRSCYYTPSGYAVALAKRMETLALPGRIYMTKQMATLAGSDFAFLDLGAFVVKGAEEPVDVFELVGKGW